MALGSPGTDLNNKQIKSPPPPNSRAARGFREMYMWGRNVRLGYLPDAIISPPHIHFRIEVVGLAEKLLVEPLT